MSSGFAPVSKKDQVTEKVNINIKLTGDDAKAFKALSEKAKLAMNTLGEQMIGYCLKNPAEPGK